MEDLILLANAGGTDFSLAGMWEQMGFFAKAVLIDVYKRQVHKWRFRPLQVGGRAHKTCTTTTFVIEFE